MTREGIKCECGREIPKPLPICPKCGKVLPFIRCACRRVVFRKSEKISSCPKCNRQLPLIAVWWNDDKPFFEQVRFRTRFRVVNTSERNITNLIFELSPALGKTFTKQVSSPGGLGSGEVLDPEFEISPQAGQIGEEKLRLKIIYTIDNQRCEVSSKSELDIFVLSRDFKRAQQNSIQNIKVAEYGWISGDMIAHFQRADQPGGIDSADDLIMKIRHGMPPHWQLVGLEGKDRVITGFNFPRTRSRGKLTLRTKPRFELVFSYKTEEKIQNFVVGRERVFLQSERGKLFAINRRGSGKKDWEKELNGQEERIGGCPPVLVDEKTIVVLNGSDEIVAFKRDAGQYIWRWRMPNGACSSNITIAGDRLYIGSRTGSIFELELPGNNKPGNIPKILTRYSIKDEEPVRGGLIPHGCMIFVASRKHLTAFLKGEEDSRYHYEIKEKVEMSPAALDDKIAILSSGESSQTGELTILQARENAFKLIGVKKLPGRPVGEPVMHADRIYVACRNGKVFALKVDENGLCGAWDKEVELDCRIQWAMALNNGWLFVVASKGDSDSIVCIEAKKGKVVASQEFESPICTAPFAANRMVYVATFDRRIHGYEVAEEER